MMHRVIGACIGGVSATPCERGIRRITSAATAATLILIPATLPFPSSLTAQDTELTALRGEIGVEPEPGTLLATVAGLSIDRMPLSEALVRLARRSRIQIAFSPSLLPPGRMVDCACATQDVARTLDRLLDGTELGYVELGAQVIIVPRAAREALPLDATLSGRVRSEVEVPVASATARLRLLADSTVESVTGTDALGFFAFRDLMAGRYRLTIGRIGYALHDQEIDLAPDRDLQLDISLAEEAIELDPVVVEARRSRQRARFEESAGITVQELGGEDLRNLPGLAEPDPVRAVTILPGVTRVSDFTAVLNVRGGSGDQNLILMDRVPLFHPYHLLGIFSVFNPDMVERAELRSGGFPAEFGGRTSSVLLVESDVGDGTLGVDAGLGLISSRVAGRGGLAPGLRNGLGLAAARWKISARRSYWDLVSRLTDSAFPYSLADFQAIFDGWTKGGDRVRINAYSGRDRINLRELDFLSTSMESVVDDLGDRQDPGWNVRWPWGNDAVGASWTHLMPGGGTLEVHGSYSRFGARFNFTEYEDTRIETEIGQSSVGADLELRPTSRTRWKSGVAATHRESRNASEGVPPNFQDSEHSGWESSAYTQLSWTPSRPWLLEAGLRWDDWRPQGGPAEAVPSPRVAVKRFLGGGRWAVRVAGGRHTQFLHSLRDERLPVAMDAWVLSGEHVPAVISDQVQAGVEGFFGRDREWFASAEGYLRTFDGVIAQNWADDPTNPADDLLTGDGRSIGIDALLRKDAGRTRGWVSVSLLKATRTFEDTDAGLVPPPIIEYPPIFDRRLEVDVAIQRDLPWGVEAGLRWNLGTGTPYTAQLARFRKYEQRLTDLRYDYAGVRTALHGPRNAARLPAYHRLDVSFRKTLHRAWGTLSPYISVINLYNRKNVLWRQRHYNHGNLTGTDNHMLPILPTLGVEVSF